MICWQSFDFFSFKIVYVLLYLHFAGLFFENNNSDFFFYQKIWHEKYIQFPNMCLKLKTNNIGDPKSAIRTSKMFYLYIFFWNTRRLCKGKVRLPYGVEVEYSPYVQEVVGSSLGQNLYFYHFIIWRSQYKARVDQIKFQLLISFTIRLTTFLIVVWIVI
jgi:hypothetical protein